MVAAIRRQDHAEGDCPSCYLHQIARQILALVEAIDSPDKAAKAVKAVSAVVGRDPGELADRLQNLGGLASCVFDDILELNGVPDHE